MPEPEEMNVATRTILTRPREFCPRPVLSHAFAGNSAIRGGVTHPRPVHRAGRIHATAADPPSRARGSPAGTRRKTVARGASRGDCGAEDRSPGGAAERGDASARQPSFASSGAGFPGDCSPTAYAAGYGLPPRQGCVSPRERENGAVLDHGRQRACVSPRERQNSTPYRRRSAADEATYVLPPVHGRDSAGATNSAGRRHGPHTSALPRPGVRVS